MCRKRPLPTLKNGIYVIRESLSWRNKSCFPMPFTNAEYFQCSIFQVLLLVKAHTDFLEVVSSALYLYKNMIYFKCQE